MKKNIVIVACCLFSAWTWAQDYQQTATGIKATIAGKKTDVEVQWYTPNTLRVFKTPQGKTVEKKSLSVVATPQNPGIKVSGEGDGQVVMKSRTLTVTLDTRTGVISYAKADGSLLLKEQELNNGLKQQYDRILQEKRKSQPMISNADSLKIVNLQLKLQNLVLSQEERQAAEAELAQLLKSAEPSVVISGETAAEIDKEMAPYREKAQKELEEYAKTVKGDLEKRRDDSRSAFQSQLSSLQDRPEPEAWNRQWKERLQAKEKEMKDVKEAILADIRTRAADVAHEQGIEMIFCEYAGVGTARDVTDDIIARLG